MTLVVAVPARTAVLFGSDTQVSDQRTRTTHVKIKRLSAHCLWAASGQVSVIQRMEEEVARLPQPDRSLMHLRAPLGLAMRAVMEDLLRTDYRTSFVQSDSYALGNLYGATCVFVEHRDGESRILSMGTQGAGEWYTRPHAIGSASDFAVALTKKYRALELDPEHAAMLVVSTLEQAIETAQSGVNYPIDLWRVDDAGAYRYTRDEVRALCLETARLRAVQREQLEQWVMTGGSLAAAVAALTPSPPSDLTRRS